MRTILFFLLVLFMFTPVLVTADDVGTDETAGETVEVAAPAATSEVIVLEDGTEEVMITTPAAEGINMFADDRVVAIEKEAREKIQAVLEEIHQLEDKSDEGKLQKEIEKIKLEAEIARLLIYLEDAEVAQDSDRANELIDEIDHLENLDQPVVGVSQERPLPKQMPTNGKEGKNNG